MLFPQQNIGLFGINLSKMGSPKSFLIEKCHKIKDNFFLIRDYKAVLLKYRYLNTRVE